MSTRILTVDDEPDVLATYQMWLEEDGYEVRTASKGSDALEVVKAWSPHVVLLDQKLEGGGGRDVGLSLIRRIIDLNPACRVLMVTAYATSEAIERAFREGADDYLEKRSTLEALLRIKVRQAAQASARAMDDGAAAEAALRGAWARAQVETDAQRKGALLEESLRRLLESVPGFTHARTNVANHLEELDVFVANRSTDPILARQGDFVVVECKNWKDKQVGTEVIDRLRGKVEKRFGRSRLGICVAPGGFAATARAEAYADRKGELLLLLLDKADLEAWIAARDRAGWLVGKIQDAVVRGS
jgi:CheY-like chemotaxis protein